MTYTEAIRTAWDALTDGQRADLEAAWNKVNEGANMDALEAVTDYISNNGLEYIGKETTDANISGLGVDDFYSIIAG